MLNCQILRSSRERIFFHLTYSLYLFLALVFTTGYQLVQDHCANKAEDIDALHIYYYDTKLTVWHRGRFLYEACNVYPAKYIDWIHV